MPPIETWVPPLRCASGSSGRENARPQYHAAGAESASPLKRNPMYPKDRGTRISAPSNSAAKASFRRHFFLVPLGSRAPSRDLEDGANFMTNGGVWVGLACLKSNPNGGIPDFPEELIDLRQTANRQERYCFWNVSHLASRRVELKAVAASRVPQAAFFLSTPYTTGPAPIAIAPPISPKRSPPRSATTAISTGAQTT